MEARTELRDKELRQFGLLLGVFLILVFGFVLPWLVGRSFPYWPWIAAILLWLPALVVPRLLRPVSRVWMAAADVLNWLTTRVVLGVIYFLLVLPIGLVMRFVRKDPMTRGRDAALPSYRVRSEAAEHNHMERPF